MFAVGQFVKVSEHHFSRNKAYEAVVTVVVDENHIAVRPFGEHHERNLDLMPAEYGRDRAEPLTLKNAPAKFTDSQQRVLRILYRAFLDGSPHHFKRQEGVKAATLAVLDKHGLIEPVEVGPGHNFEQPWQLTEAGRVAAQPVYGYPGWYELWQAVNAYYRNNVAWMKELPVMLAVQTYAMDCPDAAITVYPGYGSDLVTYSAQMGGRFVRVEQRHDEYRVLINIEHPLGGLESQEAVQIAAYITQAAKLAQRWNAARED